MEKLKHKLPPYSIIDHLCLDDSTLTQLIDCVKFMDSNFKSVFETNKGLCGTHHDLASQVYDNFYQINLTDSTIDNPDVTIDDCEIINNDMISSSYYYRKKQLYSTSGGVMDESTYTVKTKYYEQYQSLFDNILAKFKGRPTRIRLVKLMAGTNVLPHIDYDPSYAVRIIFPIISHHECLNLFWVKNNIEVTTFKPGNAYFLNTGYKHSVLNLSKTDRYTFMVSVKGTDDIDHIILD